MSTQPLKPELSIQPFTGKPLDGLLGLQPPTFLSAQEAFHQLTYVSQYAADLKCRSVALESHYIDRDHMEDHSVFYSKALFPYENYCRRLHFFSIEGDDVEKQLADIVATGAKEGRTAYDAACREFSKRAYLGFCVIKPLTGSPVGRTVLRCYPEISDDGKTQAAAIRQPRDAACGLPFTSPPATRLCIGQAHLRGRSMQTSLALRTPIPLHRFPIRTMEMS